jgi:ubiquinone/menaquinone biosynthesis C-methylase UbiE
MVNQELFIEFLRVYAFQPATAFWRAVEVDVLRGFVPSTGTILDLGCGDGKLTSILYKQIATPNLIVVGIDGDKDETQQAAKIPLYRRVHTCWASNIPEDAESFDHVISNSVLEHIKDIDATVAEVARLLKRGGTFVFTVPSPGFHRCLYGPLGRYSSRDVYLREIDKRLAHYRYWNTEEWQVLLARFGLVVEQYAEYFNCLEVKRWENISRFTAGILYALGRNRHAPIEVQKKLGLRNMQNRVSLPIWMVRLLVKVLSSGVYTIKGREQNACLLILARKNN